MSTARCLKELVASIAAQLLYRLLDLSFGPPDRQMQVSPLTGPFIIPTSVLSGLTHFELSLGTNSFSCCDGRQLTVHMRNAHRSYQAFSWNSALHLEPPTLLMRSVRSSHKLLAKSCATGLPFPGTELGTLQLV